MNTTQQAFQIDQNLIEGISDKIESGEVNSANLEATIHDYMKFMDKWSSFGWAGYIKSSLNSVISKAFSKGLCTANEQQYYLKQLDEHLASLMHKSSVEDDAFAMLKMFQVARESGTLKDFDPIRSFGISSLMYATELLLNFYSFVSSDTMGDKILEHVALYRMMYTQNADQQALVSMHDLLSYLQTIGRITSEQRDMLCTQVRDAAPTFLNTFASILADSVDSNDNSEENKECITDKFQ